MMNLHGLKTSCDLEAILLLNAQCVLAESPTWLTDQGCYLWVDIEKGHLYQLKPEEMVFSAQANFSHSRW